MRNDQAAISIPEFWRVLAFVLVGFGLALVLSWSINEAVTHKAVSVGTITSSHR